MVRTVLLALHINNGRGFIRSQLLAVYRQHLLPLTTMQLHSIVQDNIPESCSCNTKYFAAVWPPTYEFWTSALKLDETQTNTCWATQHSASHCSLPSCFNRQWAQHRQTKKGCRNSYHYNYKKHSGYTKRNTDCVNCPSTRKYKWNETYLSCSCSRG